MTVEPVAEFYESGNAPHEALGRAARRLSQGGALYLGGGVGVERQSKPTGDIFRVAKGTGSAREFPGPLSAVMHAFSQAGASTAPDTPGGAQKVSDPAAAARLRELADEEAEANNQIARYQRVLDRRARTTAAVTWSPAAKSEDDWEARRIDELKANLTSIVQERKKLLASGRVEEGALSEAETGKPGTNWKQVTPDHKRKIGPIVRHYMGKAHPFRECVRDNRERFGADAEKVCAVVKDMGEKTTKWRKGGKGKLNEAGELLLTEASERLAIVDEAFGVGTVVAIAEGLTFEDPRLEGLDEAVIADLGLLALAGHPLAVEAFVNPAQRQALANGGKAAPGQRRSPSVSSFDETKHPRGGRGSSQGGRFVSKSGGGATEVRTVQHRLGVSTDGKFGPRTEAAVRDFQRRKGLQVDGVVGRQTLAAMAGKRNAASVKPGGLTRADRSELQRIRKTQVRRRASSTPTRGRGGVIVEAYSPALAPLQE